MNKKLVAVAIAGLLAAPLAQAQTANVTLYGRANLDMEFVSGDKSTAGSGITNPTIFRVSSNSSRFGIRGTESLGGGLNAIFQIENGSIPMDTGGGNLAGRDSFVGLSGGWGRFYMGKFSAPYDAITDIQGNNTNNTGILSTGALWAQAAQDAANGGFDSRWNNAVRYDSPSYSGFGFSGEFASNEGTPSSNSNIQSYLLKYDNGPFSGRAAYEFHNNMRGGVNSNLDDTAFAIAAQWQFSGWNIAGTYEWLNYDATQSTSLKRQYWQIQSTINIGANGSLYLMYGSASDGKGSASDLTPRIGSLAHGDNTGASNWQVAYAHALSKRTSLFAGYMKVNNDSRANYSFGGNGYAVVNGGDPQGFSAGMWHNF